MKDEDKDKLEERIMAYFDGSLDGPSSKQLLAEVATDLEKQSLFESHATLARLISSARVPLETPIATNRALAEKIPGILAYLPHLFGGAETVALVSQTNPFLAFFSKFSLSTTLSVGTTVAVLTTAGIVIKNNINDNSGASSSKGHVTRSVANTEPTTTARSASNVKQIPELSQPAAGSDAAVANASSVAGARNVPGASNSSNGISKKLTANNDVFRSHQVSGSVSNLVATSSNRGTSDRATSTSSTRTNPQSLRDLHRESAMASNVSSSNARNGSSKPTRGANDAHGIESSSAALSGDPKGDLNISEVAPISGDIPQSSGIASNARIFTVQPIEESKEYVIRPFLTDGATFLFLPKVVPNSKSQRKNDDGVQVANTVSAGIEYKISERFAARAEFGQSRFGQIIPYTTKETVLGYSRIDRNIHESALQMTSGLFTTLGAGYTLNPESALRFSLQANGGYVWLSPAAPTAGVGLASEWDAFPRLTLRTALTFQNTWTSMAAASSEPEVGEIVHRELQKNTVYNMAAGISIGLILRY